MNQADSKGKDTQFSPASLLAQPVDNHLLLDFLCDWIPNLNQAHILNAEQATQAYGKTTFSDPIELDGAVIISHRSQLPGLLKFANQFKVGLYPISSGKNWGYGSVQQIKLGAKMVVDLSRLRRITEVNKELGLITIEPGVTQRDLYQYLTEHQWAYMTPTTGAGPHCSVLSNALERGYGITPITDHFSAITSLKYHVPNPDLAEIEISSAIDSLDETGTGLVDKSFKWGIGPYLDGLMAQSNLGLVTEATLRLGKRPDNTCAFYLRCYDGEHLPELVGFIRQTLQHYEGTVSSINLMDRRRLISMSYANPNDPAHHKVMSEQQIKQLSDSSKLPQWLVIGTLYGPKPVVTAIKKAIKASARGLGKLTFSDSWMINVARKIQHILPGKIGEKLRQDLQRLNSLKDIMLGVPNQVALPLAYWRNPVIKADKAKPLLPDKDNCGLLWYAPLVPMCASRISEFVAMVRKICPIYGIEPLITLTHLKHDCVDATVPIVFNNLDLESRKKALACLDCLLENGLEKGFVPYRLNIRQQHTLLNPETPYWQLVDKIKSQFDPNGILNPGRYNPV